MNTTTQRVFELFYMQELMERGASREAAENKVRKTEGTYVDWETYDAFRVFEAGVQHGRNK